MSRQRVIAAGLLGLLCPLGGGCSPTDKPCCSPGSTPAHSSPSAAAIPASQPATQGAHCCSPATVSANQQATEGTDCCSPSSTNRTVLPGTADAADPARQIIFKVEGLTCPAVKGIGCGHRLAPVLDRLDKIHGVQASSSNYTGTMLRISVAGVADRAQVAEEVRKVLSENKPLALVGEELQTALRKEQWRETERVGELSAIEFRVLALYRIKNFAQAEKLNKETTDKLMKMVEDQWKSLAQEAKKVRATRPKDWGDRCKKSIPIFLAGAKGVLNDEQIERLEKTLRTPCRGEERPEAPPAP
jgi:hypothetical protein